ncbi:MAG: hypothetical protein G01um101431_54 [Parcubacteria group bacterium Gr01-1014_31]|nr:MAG: hypothetical protein G01um101431_54 [Parcubacteria group bacterium Gr01-1014_31]
MFSDKRKEVAVSKRPKVPYWVSRDAGKPDPKRHTRQRRRGYRQGFLTDRSLLRDTDWNFLPAAHLIPQLVSRFDPLEAPRIFLVGSYRDAVKDLADAARHAYRLTVITDAASIAWLHERLAVLLRERHQLERITLVDSGLVQVIRPADKSVDGLLSRFELPFSTFSEVTALLDFAHHALRFTQDAVLIIHAPWPPGFGFLPTGPWTISCDGKAMSDLHRSVRDHGLDVVNVSPNRFDFLTVVITRRQTTE